MLEHNPRYDRPIGGLAQRLTGVVLGATAAFVAWMIVREIMQAGWSNQRFGIRIFEVLVLAALPWCAITARRLLRGTLASEPLMPPAAFVAFGVVIGLVSCLGVLLIATGHATLGDFDVVEGFAIAVAAIGFGIRKRRQHRGGEV